jgi:hypothetical protein
MTSYAQFTQRGYNWSSGNFSGLPFAAMPMPFSSNCSFMCWRLQARQGKLTTPETLKRKNGV